MLVDHRLHLLARLNGEPTASTHIARIRQKFDFSSIEALKNSIIRLRDISRCAADVLIQIPQLRVSKQVLNASDIIDYVKNNVDALGYQSFNDEDKELVAYLVAQSSMPEYSWTLKWSDTLTGVFPNLDALYKSVTAPTYSPCYYTPGAAIVVDGDHRISDDVTKSIRSLFETRGDGMGDNKIKAAKRLKSYLRHTCQYSDIFLLDHILTLMSDTEIWLKFIPNRSADVPGENVERLNGLAAFAGYLHSLLLVPYYFEFNFFKVTYDMMEKWLSGFPAVSGTVVKNLETMVSAHDFFGIESIVQTVAATWKGSDNIHGSEITTLPSEFIALYNMKSTYDLAIAKANTVRGNAVAITDLSELSKSDYAHVLMSLSIEKLTLRSDATAAVYDKAVFKHFSEHYSHTIASLIMRYLTPQVLTNMKTYGLKCELPLAISSPVVPNPEVSTQFAIGSKPSYVIGTPSRTFDTERILRRKYLLKVASATVLCKELTSNIAYDEVVAKQLRDHSAINFESLYPSFMCESGISYTLDTLRSLDTLMLNEIFEFIANGDSIEYIKRAFVSSAYRERWATVLSSFALLFEEVSASGPGVYDLKDLELRGTKATGKTKPSYISLIRGFGNPYGMSYEELMKVNVDAWKKSGKPVHSIKLFDDSVGGEHSYHLIPLEFVPEPSNHLAAGVFAFSYPYYYRRATTNGDLVLRKIQHLNWGNSLLHFAMRKINAAVDYPPVLFDRMFAYLNECLYIQDDVMATLPKHESDQPALTDRENKWSGQKYQAYVRYIVPASYTSGTGAGSGGSSEESQQLQTMITAIEEQNAAAVMKSPDVNIGENTTAITEPIKEETGKTGDAVADFKADGKSSKEEPDKGKKKRRPKPSSNKSSADIDPNIEKDEHDEEE